MKKAPGGRVHDQDHQSARSFVAYTDKINELLVGFEESRVLAEVGKHDQITAEVNISVSDSKDEDPAMRKFQLSEAGEEEQKRRFLTPDDPLCFLVVTAKLMTGFDAPNEGVLYLDKPLKAHSLFQTITRPNRTWVFPTGFVKTQGVVVDYIGLAEEVQRAVNEPTTEGAGKGGGFVPDLSELVAEFRVTFAGIEDLFVDVDGLDLTVHGYESVRAINVFLDANPGAAEVFFSKDYRLLARLYPLISTDNRVAKYRDGFGLFGSVYTTLFKKSSDEERKERLAELGPMVLEIINGHVHSFSVAQSQEEALVLDAQGIAILKELPARVGLRPVWCRRSWEEPLAVRGRAWRWTASMAARDRRVGEPGDPALCCPARAGALISVNGWPGRPAVTAGVAGALAARRVL
ncbi:hypothetical protein STENM327S_03019 [Streptomyces tendae]